MCGDGFGVCLDKRFREPPGAFYSTREVEDKLVEAIRHENKEQQDVESEPLLRPQDPKQVEMGVTSDVSG